MANGADDLIVLLGRRSRWDFFSLPPRRLRASVGQPSRRLYREEGRMVAGELQQLLAEIGRPLAGFERVCDLASGPGKVLCELDLDAAEYVAAIDVNREAITWLNTRLPRVDARAEDVLPPTSFEESHFDLLISISLFTHLPEARQDAWLAEVARLLKPGSTAVLTVHGATAYEGFRAGSRRGVSARQLTALRARGPLPEVGFCFEPEDHPDRRGAGIDDQWGLAFHDAGYMRRHWSRYLDIERVVPSALNFRQDAVIVRRR